MMKQGTNNQKVNKPLKSKKGDDDDKISSTAVSVEDMSTKEGECLSHHPMYKYIYILYKTY